MWGQKIDFYEGIVNHEMPELQDLGTEAIDRLVLEYGLNPQIDPTEHMMIDEDTQITVKDMIELLRQAQENQDYEQNRRLETDLKQVKRIGAEIHLKQAELLEILQK